MASTIILSDNGASSGSAGLKSTAGNDGVLILQTTTSGGTATNALTIDTIQNVGIGTSSPTVYGSYKTLEVRGSGGGLLQIGTGASTAAYLFQDGTNAGFTNIANGVITLGTNNTERMRIDASGNVGIGTSSPTYKLHIAGDNNGIAVTAGSGTAASILVASNGNALNTASFDFIQGADNNGYIYNRVNGNIYFGANNTNVGAFTTAGNFQMNSGYGSVATAYGCRAWVNFDGTTNTGGFCTIRASANVSTVADNGTGDYTVTFSNAMTDANYCYSLSGQSPQSLGEIYLGVQYNQAPTTTTIRVRSFTNSTVTVRDAQAYCVAIFR